MAKQSKAWSENTDRLVKTLCLILFCLIPGNVLPDNAGQAGSILGNSALQRFGFPEGVNKEIAAPLTSSNTPMQTLDGSKTFSAQLLCPSSRKFIEVFIQPTGSGDLAQVSVSQDIDMDGNVDFVFTVPFPVSGVCANGVISCDPGTWENCRYFRWEADGSVRIGLTTVGAISELGGCYCLNTSCGNSLAQGNMTNILKDLGGGVASAVQAVNRKYAITDVHEEGTTITYYGEDAGKCSGSPSPYGSSSPELYYNPGSASGLTGAKDAARASQSGDPSSYYSIISNSQAAQESQGDYRQCSIMRNITVTTVTGCSSPGDSFDAASGSCTINDLSPYPRTLKTHDGGGGNGCFFPQPGSILPDGGSIYIGNYLCGDPYGGVVKNARIRFRCGGMESIVYSGEYQTAILTCPSGDLEWIEGRYYTSNAYHIDCPPGYSDGLCGGLCCMKPPDRSDVIEDAIDDRCRAYEDDAKCRLREEQTDGVYTASNYIPTSLIPLSSCKTYMGYLPHEVCRDWWRKDRTYTCEAPGRYDFEDTRKRADSIYLSSAENAGSLAYTDLRKNVDGTWTAENVVSPLGTLVPDSVQNTCDQACKTRKSKSDTQAGKMGNKAQYQKTAAAYDFFYRLCRNGVCPVGDGEEIVASCSCINDFPGASSVLSVLDAAGKDLICTTGARY